MFKKRLHCLTHFPFTSQNYYILFTSVRTSLLTCIMAVWHSKFSLVPIARSILYIKKVVTDSSLLVIEYNILYWYYYLVNTRWLNGLGYRNCTTILKPTILYVVLRINNIINMHSIHCIEVHYWWGTYRVATSCIY